MERRIDAPVLHHEAALARLLDLAEEARAFAGDARAANTRRAYRADWTDFVAWCADAGLPALPADPQTVALYITDRARTLKTSTLERRLAALSQAHKAAGYPSPASTALEPLHSIWAGLRRNKGTVRDKKTPVLVEDTLMAESPSSTTTREATR